jgi:hypothetical protein
MQSQHMREVTDRIIYDKLLSKLELFTAECGSGRVDGLDLSYRMCADYLSSFLFGDCNGTNFLEHLSRGKAKPDSEDSLETWRFHYENLSCRETFFVQEMPRLYRLSKALGINLLPRPYFEATEYLENWMSAMTDKADRTIAMKQSEVLQAKDEPVIYEAAKEAVKKDSPHLSLEAQQLQVQSEMFDHICKISRSICY